MQVFFNIDAAQMLLKSLAKVDKDDLSYIVNTTVAVDPAISHGTGLVTEIFRFQHLIYFAMGHQNP